MKKYILNIIKLFFLVLLLTKCGKPVDITDRYTVSNGKVPPFSIEGLVVSGKGPHTVKILRTVAINSDQVIPVNNAIVTISDNVQTDTLVFDGVDSYVSDTLNGIVGKSGTTYIMNAIVEGKNYVATSTMPLPLYPIDSVNFALRKDTKDNYIARLYAKVRTDIREYYMFLFYRNGVLQNEPDDVVFADNSQLNGYVNGIETADDYKLGDEFKMKFFSIPKEGYDFYWGIQAQLGNDGGVFSTPPANVKGNISGGALGLFQACYLIEYATVVK